MTESFEEILLALKNTYQFQKSENLHVDNDEIPPSGKQSYSIPETNEYRFLTKSQVIELYHELKKATLSEELDSCYSHKRYLLRVALKDDKFFNYNTTGCPFPFLKRTNLKLTKRLDNVVLHCSLTRGLTLFNILIAKENKYFEEETNLGPCVYDDLFIEVKFNKKISENKARVVAHAYIFELAKNGLELEVASRPGIFEPDEFVENISVNKIRGFSIRGLFDGEVDYVLEKYIHSLSLPSQLCFLENYKIIEYISQTILYLQLLKLKNTNEKNLIDSFKKCKKLKDFEIIKILIKKALSKGVDLSKYSDKFVNYFQLKDLKSPYAKYTKSLISTRAYFSHDKAAYDPKDECPEELLSEFFDFTKEVIQNCIEWYSKIEKSKRVSNK